MGLIFRVLVGLFSIGCFAGSSFVSELWVRDDFLKAPKATHLTAAYAQLAHSDASLSLGILPIPFPVELPEARGPLLFNPLPSYSHRSGLSEWGKGFERSLRIEHFAEAGEANCNEDIYLSPWGKLQQSNEKNVYYPKGLEIDLRVLKTPNGFIAYHPDGTVFEFTREYAHLAWYLTHIKDREGHRTVFEYTPNSFQRPLLSKVKYGGKKIFQYEIAIAYERRTLPIKRYGGCGLDATIDSRVHEIEIRHWDGTVFKPAKLLRLIHEGAYLSRVQIEFPSKKENLPDIHYHYGKIESVVGKTHGRIDPQFQVATDSVDDLHFFSKHISWVDYNQDGLPDFERATDLKSFLQTTAGNFVPYQDFYVATRNDLCPPSGPYNHFMAPSERRRLFIRPAGITDTMYHMRLASDVNRKGSLTKIIVCSLDGEVAYQKEVFSALESAMSFELSTHLADLNGDLKPDLIKVGDDEYTYILNASTNGHIQFEDKVTRPLPGADNRRVINYSIVDFNLDGFVDIVAQVRGGVMVWYGRGNQIFGPEEHFFTFTTPEGWILDLQKMQVISWVDVNRDGLVDLVASLSGSPIFFMQGGDTLLEQRFPDLGNGLELLNSYKVINLSGGGNDQLATLEWNLGYIYFDLNEPTSGLLTRIDNNQGLSIEISYGWTKPEVGIPQLMIVPKSLFISASGKETRSTVYEFANPDIDSRNGQLIGFQRIKTIAPHGTNAITFLTSSDFAPKVQSMTQIDERVDVSQIEKNEWLESVVSGVPVLLLVRAYQAYASNGLEILRRSTGFSNYNRLCPQSILEKTPDGELARTIHYSDTVGCQKVGEKITGRHASRADFDFEHAYEIKRNEADLPLGLDLLSDSERIRKTALSYDDNLNLKQVSQASIGDSFLEYDPAFEILKLLTEPDGVIHEIRDYDAVADAMSDFVTKRPNGENLTQHFGYDGYGRLNRSENNWSQSLFSYQLPNQTSPGLVSDSLTRVTSIAAGDGTVLTRARDAGNGFIYEPLHRWRSSGAIETEIDLSGNHLNPQELNFKALDSYEKVLGETEHSDLFGVLKSKQTVSHQQTRDMTRRIGINPRELQATVVENNHHEKKDARSFATNESGSTTHFERDVLDRLREIRLPSGETQKICLDAFGRTEHIMRSNVGRISYVYDNAHDRLLRKNILGEEECFEYDCAGRLKKRGAYEFEYQGERLTQVTHPDFTKRFTYAADGIPVKQSLVEHRFGSVIEVEVEYNAARDVTEHKVNFRGVYAKRFNYNQHRELRSIVVGQAVFEIERNEVGKVAKIKLPEGKELNVEYDPLTWKQIGYEIPNVARYQWRLNSRGLIDQSEFVPANNKAQRFGYEYRPDQTLKSRYSLDNPFDFLNFELPEIPTPYVQTSRPEGVYDENRHLVAKYHDGNLAYLQFGGVSADANHVYEKLSIEGIHVGILVDGEFRLVLFDQVGSVIADGDFVSIASPYGKRQHSLAIGEHFDFAGHGRDQETGLIRMGEREYDPQLQRFASPDRFYLENPEECVRSPQECDLYSYARNNPLLFTDSTGRYVDTALDIVSIASDIYELYHEPSWLNAGALGLDVVGAALPFATGLGKGFKAINKALDAEKASGEVSKKTGKAVNEVIERGANGKSSYAPPKSPTEGYTNKDFAREAKKLGYDRRVPPQKAPFESHGKPAYTNGKLYITPDRDVHNGGFWKVFDGKDRLGTFTKDLTTMIKD